MKQRGYLRRLAASFVSAMMVVCCVPALAFAVQTPVEAQSFEEAQAWAEEYVKNASKGELQALSVSNADESQGYELVALSDSSWELLAVQADASWYNGASSDFSISSGSQLMGLAQLVNDGVTFEGKTVRVLSDIAFINTEITPIGGANGRVFNGTFDGQGHVVRGFTITSTDGDGCLSNFALFGECGANSVIKNVQVPEANISVTRSSSSSAHVSNIAALVATTKGSIENCSSSATVKVSVDSPQTATDTVVASKIGGVAAVVYGDVKNCSFGGTVNVSSNTTPSGESDANGRSDATTIVKNIGGVVGYLGDPNQEEHAKASAHGSISNCSFTGRIEASTPSTAGKDRFGETVLANSGNLGGIVGYSQGSVSDCTASGTLEAAQGDLIGGIIGSFRALGTSGLGDMTTMDYGTKDDVITCSRCRTTDAASVHGLHAAGGIVGGSGTYTLVSECANAAYVVGDRWNKPSVGGVVGQCYQDIHYSSNTGTVETGTGGGYYVAGVAGMLLQYKEGDGTPNHPTPEVYGCYSTGRIVALKNMKSAGLVGENDGNVHDCLVLEGTTTDGVLQVDDSSSGSTKNCAFYSTSDLKSTKACGMLNQLRSTNGPWDNYFVLPNSNSFPQLKVFATMPSATTLSSAGLNATCTSNAAYSGSEAIPSLTVSFNGKTLVQNADFYVVPQSGATKLGSGYSASIVGIGLYEGQVSNVCNYGIDKGDLANCTVTIKTQKFDYTQKTLSSDDVTVTDAYGNELPSEWYSYAFEYCTVDGQSLPVRYISPSKSVNMTTVASEYSKDGIYHFGYYPVKVTATSSSYYTGETEGLFKIKPADIMTDCTIDSMQINVNGTTNTYKWNSSTKSGTFIDGSPVINYTGSQIKPTVSSVTYNGHTLKEGSDYKLVYGNPNSDSDSTDYTDYNNIGTQNTNSVGCVTVRFIGGGRPSDFDNYVNMYFVIHGQNASAVPSIANCTIVANDQVYTGKEIMPVKIYTSDGKELSSEYYRTSYTNNTNVGTATFTVMGTRDYTGVATGTFKICDPADALGYVDVSAADWYVQDGTLAFVREAGLMHGTDNDNLHFEPYSTASRAQVATVLWRYAYPEAYAGYDQASTYNKTGMPDVADREWYTGAVNWAVDTGVFEGYEHDDGTRTFGPNDPVTREQMCKIIACFAQKLNGADIAATTDKSKLSSMPDALEVSSWASDYVAWALTNGVINGSHENGVYYIHPVNGLARCEMGKIMMNCMQTSHIISRPEKTIESQTMDDALEQQTLEDTSKQTLKDVSEGELEDLSKGQTLEQEELKSGLEESSENALGHSDRKQVA